MTIAALYFGEDKTWVAVGNPKKGRLMLQGLDQTKSYISELEAGDKRALTTLLQEVVSFAGKNPEVYVSLPARLVQLDCTDNAYCNLEKDGKNGVLACAAGLLQVSETDYQISLKKDRYYLTAGAVLKKQIHGLMHAADSANAALVCAEPEQLSVLRYLDTFQTPSCQFSIGENDTTISGYHPQKGIFSRQLKGYGFGTMLAQPPERFAEAIVKYDLLAMDTFGVSAGEPVYLVGAHSKAVFEHVCANDEINTRIQSVSFNSLISSENFTPDLLTQIPVLGAALAPIAKEERRNTGGNAVHESLARRILSKASRK